MQLHLYQFTKRSNSTKQPSYGGIIYNVELKSGTSIYNPTFTLRNFNIEHSNRNYAEWNGFYYYIKDIIQERQGYSSIECTLDYLATFKENILNTSAFVLYSTNNADSNIIDDRLTMNRDITISKSNLSLFPTIDYTYIISHIGESDPILFWTTENGYQNMCKQLLTSSFFGDLDKTLSGSTSSVQSITMLPFYPVEYSSLQNFHLGKGDRNIPGTAIKTTNHLYTKSGSVAIPWNYNDFRNKSKFTSIEIYLPSYGVARLSADEFQNKSSISIKATTDLANGGLTYLVDNRFKFDTNIGTPISFGSIGNNVLNALPSLATSALGVAMGDPISSTVGLFSAVSNAITPTVGTGGSNGSSSSFESKTNVTVSVISFNTNVEPSTMYDIYGGPCKRVLSLGNCTGFVQTVNASVSVNTSDEIIENINSALNGGVYIE